MGTWAKDTTTIVTQVTAVVGVMVGLWVSQSVVQATTQRSVVLCGRALANSLELVCAGRGFNFKRSAPSTGGAEGKRSGGTVVPSSSTVVDECCRRACNYSVLESYCAPTAGLTVTAEDDLLEFFTGGRRFTPPSSTGFTTTQSSAHYDPNAPSAQIFRGHPAGQPELQGRVNPPFFYLVGSRPTRNPLITK